jgi:hypothetical protein
MVKYGTTRLAIGMNHHTTAHQGLVTHGLVAPRRREFSQVWKSQTRKTGMRAISIKPVKPPMVYRGSTRSGALCLVSSSSRQSSGISSTKGAKAVRAYAINRAAVAQVSQPTRGCPCSLAASTTDLMPQCWQIELLGYNSVPHVVQYTLAVFRVASAPATRSPPESHEYR